MEDLVLHIGTPKTGTTSLQKALNRNKKLLLQEDILYPLSSSINNTYAHHNFYYEYSPGLRYKYKPDKGGTAQIAEEFNNSPAKSLILSSEGLKSLPNETICYLLTTIVNTFKPKRIVVVLYIRRSDLYLHSGFVQNCKLGQISLANPESYISSLLHIVVYDKLFLKWNSALKAIKPETKIIVRPFSRDLLVDKCVVRDFLALLASEGIISESLSKNPYFKITNANKKPKLSHLAIRMHLKKILESQGKSITPKIAIESSRILDEQGYVDNFESFTLFSLEQALEIYKSSLPSTKRLCSWLNNSEITECLTNEPTTKQFPGLPNDFDINSTEFSKMANFLIKEHKVDTINA